MVVQAEGYWQNRSAQLSSRLGIRLGDNLFEIDPGELRKRLSAIPSVENCEVTRILPDTLKLRVVERIPRAVLANPQGRWVVDENCVVIPRAESMSAGRSLPVILGISDRSLEGGMVLPALQPVMEIIMQVAQNFRDIDIKAVHMREPRKNQPDSDLSRPEGLPGPDSDREQRRESSADRAAERHSPCRTTRRYARRFRPLLRRQRHHPLRRNTGRTSTTWRLPLPGIFYFFAK